MKRLDLILKKNKMKSLLNEKKLPKWQLLWL